MGTKELLRIESGVVCAALSLPKQPEQAQHRHTAQSYAEMDASHRVKAPLARPVKDKLMPAMFYREALHGSAYAPSYRI